MAASTERPEAAPSENPVLPSERRVPVPSALGRKVLAFEFVVLVEYWLAPLFLGVTNYAGTWSDIGAVLFLLFVGTLLVWVIRPLRPHLRRTFGSSRNRVVFHGLWSASFVLGLFVTNILQFVDGPSSGPVALGQTTVYSAFGAWPSLTVYFPSVHVWATLNPEGSTILLLLSVLSSASIVLGPMQRARACPSPASRTWGTRLASAGILAPLGFISGCPSCSPLYFAALAVVAPGTAEGAQAGIPLVPWIGFAGLVYLFGFWLALRLIQGATASPRTVETADPAE